MSFFRKLRDRLTKSSAKIDEGVDALMAEGEPVEASSSAAPADRPAPAQEPAPPPHAEAAPAPQPAAPSEA
ncbi:MAG: signal recognition particle-docking protein FtsY, partial [Pseudomonadota bacterium]